MILCWLACLQAGWQAGQHSIRRFGYRKGCELEPKTELSQGSRLRHQPR